MAKCKGLTGSAVKGLNIFRYINIVEAAVVENIWGQCPSKRGAEWRALKTGESRRRSRRVGGVWEACPLPILLGVLGERRELPSGSRRNTADKRFLVHFELEIGVL